MGVSDGTEDDTRDPFEAGAEDATDATVLFIDAKQLNSPDLQENIDNLVGQVESMLPGISRNATQEQLEETVKKSQRSPWSVAFEHDGQEYCIISKPNYHLDQKEEIVSALSDHSVDEIGYIPGTDALWNRAMGVHEGEHCNQEDAEHPDPHAGTWESLEEKAVILNFEIGSDRAVKADMEAHGEHEAALFFKDIKALGLIEEDDPVHSTSRFLDGPEAGEATVMDVMAAGQTVGVIESAIARDTGIPLSDVGTMKDVNPDAYMESVKRVIADGAVGGFPQMQEYAQDYAEAYKRVIADPDPVTDPHLFEDGSPLAGIDGGKPQIVPGETSDEMQIGGVRAGDYFASYADRALAEQRLAMERQAPAPGVQPEQPPVIKF